MMVVQQAPRLALETLASVEKAGLETPLEL